MMTSIYYTLYIYIYYEDEDVDVDVDEDEDDDDKKNTIKTTTMPYIYHNNEDF